MKIVLSANRFRLPFVGGVDVYADRLGRALARAGHEVSLIGYDDASPSNGHRPFVDRDGGNGSHVWRVPAALDARTKESFDRVYDANIGRAVEEILRQEQPDLFVALNFYLSTLASVEAAKALGIPVVHIATDFVPVCRRATFIRWNGVPCQRGESVQSCATCFVSHRSLGRAAAAVLGRLPEETVRDWARRAPTRPPHPRWLLRPYLRQAATMEARLATVRPLRAAIDLVLAPTRYTEEVFLANGFRRDQVRYMPFAVEADHPLARVHHEPAAHTRFLFVGRLLPYKGVDLLVEAFDSLERPGGATLTIYGAPAGDHAYYERLQARMAANDRIQFGGTIPTDELPRAFAAADYFVLPSIWHENSPLILLDAVQSRTPVIASAIGGVTDVIRDGENGLLFPMGDVQVLKQVLQRAIDEPELRPRLAAGRPLPLIDDYAAAMLDLVGEKVAA